MLTLLRVPFLPVSGLANGLRWSSRPYAVVFLRACRFVMAIVRRAAGRRNLAGTKTTAIAGSYDVTRWMISLLNKPLRA